VGCGNGSPDHAGRGRLETHKVVPDPPAHERKASAVQCCPILDQVLCGTPVQYLLLPWRYLFFHGSLSPGLRPEIFLIAVLDYTDHLFVHITHLICHQTGFWR
jgi:hypothetical protein